MTVSKKNNTGAAFAAPVTLGRVPTFRRSRRLKIWFPYLLVAPAVIYLLLITLYPGAYAAIQSFYAVKFGPWNPVGWASMKSSGMTTNFGVR